MANNACEAVSAFNCKTYSAANTCQDCITGYVLKVVGNNTTCESHTEPNCDLYEPTKGSNDKYPCI